MNWDQYFRAIANQVKAKSKDERTKIGAVIVGSEHEIVSTGYNSFPRGIDDTVPRRQERPEKYYWMMHAEQNAIVNAARIGVSTKGCVMYLTCGIPCADCAKAIINAGISKIVCEIDTTLGASGEMWKEHAERSLIMFEESNVEIAYYEW
jgi:dCMP deaminase